MFFRHHAWKLLAAAAIVAAFVLGYALDNRARTVQVVNETIEASPQLAAKIDEVVDGRLQEFAATLPQDSGAGDPEQIGMLVREYLLANPELMLEIQDALERKQEIERVAAQQQAIESQSDLIFASRYQVEIGPSDADVKVVEFFDYNCGFCRRALDDMNRFLATDDKVQFVLKEFPVLGQESLDAARVSIAFSRMMPEQYGEFHQQLLSAQGIKDGERAIEVALSLGADEQVLRTEMQQPYIQTAIREAYDLADALGITGTPSYVVGNEVVFGAVGYDNLRDKVTNVRECAKTVC